MNNNILVAILLVVGLLTPVFGWLFYCWFRSHLTDQHHEGQIFHRRARDRTQANWRQAPDHPGSTTLGPYFTERGWVRQKPYGDTRVLPLSQMQMPPNSPRTNPPQTQQPNALSKRQQRKQRAEQNRQRQQMQKQNHPPDNQACQDRPKQKSKKNKNKSQIQAQNHSSNQSPQKLSRKRAQEEHGDGWPAITQKDSPNNNTKENGDDWGNLGSLFENAENGQQNDNEEGKPYDNERGDWKHDNEDAAGWGQTGWGAREESPSRHSHAHENRVHEHSSWGQVSHHQNNHNGRKKSPNGSLWRVSPDRSKARGHNSSYQQGSSWENNRSEHQRHVNDPWEEGHDQKNEHIGWNESRHASPDRRSRDARSPKHWDREHDGKAGGWGDDNDRKHNDWYQDTGHCEGNRSWEKEGNGHQNNNRGNRRRNNRNHRSPSNRNQETTSQGWGPSPSPEPKARSPSRSNKALEW